MASNKRLIIFLIFLIIALSAFMAYYIMHDREGTSADPTVNENINTITRSVDPFLGLYENVEKICTESGGTYKGCPHCVKDQACECSPCDCPDGMFIDYAIGCRTL